MVSPMTSVTDRVMGAITSEPLLKDAKIDAAFERGVVTLTGTVKTEDARQTAEQIARQQQGVVMVVNELRVA